MPWLELFSNCQVLLVNIGSLPAMWETRVRSLGWEDPLGKEMATHSWKIPWTEEPGRLQSMGLQRVRHDWTTSLLLIILDLLGHLSPTTLSEVYIRIKVSHFNSIKIFQGKITKHFSPPCGKLLCKRLSTIESKIASSCEGCIQIPFVCLFISHLF